MWNTLNLEQSCHLKDWVVVESGEDVKWKGQVRRLALHHKLIA